MIDWFEVGSTSEVNEEEECTGKTLNRSGADTSTLPLFGRNVKPRMRTRKWQKSNRRKKETEPEVTEAEPSEENAIEVKGDRYD